MLERAQSIVKQAVHGTLASVGKLRLRTAEEDILVATVPYEYIGDVNGEMNDIQRRNIKRVDLKTRPPRVETQHDLYYSSRGMAWVSGTLVQHYSIRKPSVREALAFPPSGSVEELEEAYIVESDVPYTYGDWVHTYLAAYWSLIRSSIRS